jgi:ATP-dependent DNA ligase
LFKSGDHLVVATKRGGIYTPDANPLVFAKFPELLHAPHRMILDGEYVRRDGLHFFDVLQVDDRDVRILPLEKRKEIVHEILAETGLETPTFSAHSIDEIRKFRDDVFAKGGAGVFVKNPSSRYGESGAWLRLRRPDVVDCFVIQARNAPGNDSAKSWDVGLYDDRGQVVSVGVVNSFVEKVNSAEVRAGSVVQLRFRGVLDRRTLEAPFILRVRHDKTPEECLLSQFSSN